MNDKLKNIFCSICNAAILSGLIILLIGSYYWAIKAGIPYQDPPLELQIKYAVNMEIGNVLLKTGAVIFLVSGIMRLFLLKLHSHPNKTL